MKLSDLKPQVTIIAIQMPDGSETEIRVQPLTMALNQELGRRIAVPKPPDKPVVKDGKKTTEPDYANPEYRRDLETANMRRAALRIGYMLKGGGDFDELADKDDESLIDEILALDSGIFSSLSDAANQLFSGARARVDSRAATFRPD